MHVMLRQYLTYHLPQTKLTLDSTYAFIIGIDTSSNLILILFLHCLYVYNNTNVLMVSIILNENIYLIHTYVIII